MVEQLTDAVLSQLSSLVSEKLGLNFPRKRWADLERGIGAVARELGMANAAECAVWLASTSFSGIQAETLAANLTVGETYFFREKRSFEVLENEVFPELIRLRQNRDMRLRVWSAGCCTGEEPYSVAILLSRLLPNISDWNIKVLATDINPRALERAVKGVYGEWSFRGTPDWIRRRYFTETAAGEWKISDEIKKFVTFSYLNLVEDVYPSITNETNAMDVVFCRNVLMYFVPEFLQRVSDRLYRTILENGWLLVGPSETSQTLFEHFAPIYFPGVVFYRKQSKRPFVSRAAAVFDDYPMPPEDNGQLDFPAGDTALPDSFTKPEVAALSSVPAEDSNLPEKAICNIEEAEALYRDGRWEGAEKVALILAKDEPLQPEVSALLSRICADAGRLPEALVWSDRAVDSARMNPAYRYLRAMVQDELGNSTAAVTSFEQALYLDDTLVVAHFALANLQRRLEMQARSAIHFRVALSLLNGYAPDELLPESEGLTAGRLIEIITAATAGV